MRWIKKGLLYATDQYREWSVTHATAPYAFPLGNDIYRVFFSTRDSKNRSYTMWVDVDASSETWKVINRPETPAVSPGPLGSFDESGVVGDCVVQNGNRLFLYYHGFNLGVTVPFRLAIGLAISDGGGENFTKLSEGPLLDRTPTDAYLLATPFVVRDNGIWKMWYVSGSRWESTPGGPKHFFHVRYAWSGDGINWVREGKVCIDYKNDLEYAISRPSVLIENGVYRMWYCYRASEKAATYRIGYAESGDGESWVRMDHLVGIDVSAEGWDSEMICYPHVFRHKGQLFMIYNGNAYGKTGFGYAVLEE
ncbi:MAG: hypothetical protein ACOY40_04450 [Bacillota bacterium]